MPPRPPRSFLRYGCTSSAHYARALPLSLLIGLAPMPMQMAFADDMARVYNIPRGELAASLTRFASQAGVSLSVAPALVNGRQSAGLVGEYSVEGGFAQLLSLIHI